MALKTSRRQPVVPDAVAPRHGTAWAILVYALATLALVYPAFGGSILVNPSSDQLNGLAYRYFGAAQMHATGGIPLWNPYELGGIPFVAAQHGDIFYPTAFFRLFATADHVLTWSLAVHLFLCGLLTWGFLRASRVGWYGALVGGLAYMLGCKVASLVSPGHDGKLYVNTLTPLLLWMLLRGVRDGARWAWGAIAIVTALCIFTPHFQLTYYLGILAGAYGIWLAFRKGPDALAPRQRWTRLGLAAASAALGLAVAAIHLMPFFEYIPYSPRGGGKGWEYATSYSMPPEEFLNVYLPQFSGILEHYWGRGFFKLHGEYLGALVLLLAGAAFGSVGHRRDVRFWAIVFALFTLWAFGGYTPLYHLIYLLPMMSKVRAPDMIFFIPTFAGAILAAIGTERLLAGEKGARYLYAWLGGALVVGLLASVGAFTGIAHALVPPERWDAVDANAGAVTLGAWRSFLVIALGAGVLLALLRGRIDRRVAGWALAVLVAADLWSIDRYYFQWSPPGSQLYASDPALDYLARLPEPGRTLVLMPTQQGLENPGDPVLSGDGAMVHGVRTVSGHQGNELQRWVELAGGKSPAPPVNALQPQFRRLANVRYWYTNVELPERIPDLPNTTLKKIMGPVRNAAGNQVFLYQFAGEDNPDAWVAPVIAKATDPATFATVMDARFDPRLAAIFPDSAQVPAVDVKQLPAPSPVRAAVTRIVPGHMSVQLDQPAPAGSALVVSENWYPGWTATADGKPATLARADYSLIGVVLPAGARAIELSFTDPAYTRGKLVTIVALLLTALLVAVGTVLDRRRRVQPVVVAEPAVAHG